MILARDFNINAPDDHNKKIQNFFNLIYRYNMMPTINKWILVGKQSATAIDHIIASYIVHSQLKIVTLRTEVAYYFPNAMVLWL